MALKIRLARGGSKKRPFYSVVIADARAPRDVARFLSKIELDGKPIVEWAHGDNPKKGEPGKKAQERAEEKAEKAKAAAEAAAAPAEEAPAEEAPAEEAASE